MLTARVIERQEKTHRHVIVIVYIQCIYNVFATAKMGVMTAITCHSFSMHSNNN